jgi:hypothetical protein
MGRHYVEQAFTDDDPAVSSFGEPIVGVDGRAAVEDRATVTTVDGRTGDLAGVSALRFRDDGLVREHRDHCTMMESA